jgi:hypothetical protein
VVPETRRFDNGITLNTVDEYHTSKWGTHYSAVGRRHDGSNYSLFRCKGCDLTLNSDRKSSLSVAIKPSSSGMDFLIGFKPSRFRGRESQ